ncbi:hypothetical protein RRV45_15420 [Bacillus sp. DTU_2020_1000418_1_SI_GHA_SEK_038]|uniref:hypothetical protein n=1 Tax=Bacillus sp. DTU_2020_1000418_1_SI_GHA_SEK_038 TaxID=3077585 RepID=UPI0028EE0747|nr:hypothetical protein [Bacillus sp. DTU_2020_1000418_1_SI_GHA_SEK_038]WNS74299.1 hypothetical protein RRV45_15420 [Bacillus sp. DTU_2020_1000418_1_SI_GHA_SEK_038]
MKIKTWIQPKAAEEIIISNKEGIEVIPGVWIEGKTYWLTPGVESMIPEEGLSVYLQQEEGSPFVQLYNVSVTNFRERQLHIKLLIQNRHYQSSNRNHFFEEHKHFSFISPSEKVVFHLDQHKVHLANGHCQGKANSTSTIQSIRNVFTDHIWACPITGKLQYNPMANGDAVSLFLYDCHFLGKQTIEGKSWVISGENETDLIKLNEALLKTH